MMLACASFSIVTIVNESAFSYKPLPTKLHDLKQKGIITEADFEKRKNQLLG